MSDFSENFKSVMLSGAIHLIGSLSPLSLLGRKYAASEPVLAANPKSATLMVKCVSILKFKITTKINTHEQISCDHMQATSSIIVFTEMHAKASAHHIATSNLVACRMILSVHTVLNGAI